MELQNRQIADFALRTTYEDIGSINIEQLKRHLLDAFGSLISCLHKPSVQKLQRQLLAVGEGGECCVPVLKKLAIDRAAKYYTALIRYPDFMDNFIGKEATCHPSDNIGALMAVAASKSVSGKDFLTAMAIAYQIECRLVEEIPVMKEGIDHTLFLSYSIVSSVGRLLGLSREQIAHGLAIAGSSISPMVTSRASYTYEWKGFASSQVALVCFDAVMLARQDMTGPVAIFEGPKGFADVFDMKLKYDWSKENFSLIEKCCLKSYNAEVHTQTSVAAALELRRAGTFHADEIDRVKIHTFLTAYHITGSGMYGDRKIVESKEQADHSMFYVVAVALLDGELYPEQLTPERINRQDVQQLLKKIDVETFLPFHTPFSVAGMLDPYTIAYPEKLKTKVTVHSKTGKSFTCEKDDYHGFFTDPFSWNDTITKFKRLSSGNITNEQQEKIIELVQHLETRNVADLIDLICAP